MQRYQEDERTGLGIGSECREGATFSEAHVNVCNRMSLAIETVQYRLKLIRSDPLATGALVSKLEILSRLQDEFSTVHGAFTG